MLAEIQGEEGHPDAARETLLHVPPTDPLAPVAMFRLSMFDIAAGRLDDAIALLNKLSSRSPEQTAGQAQVQRVLGGALLEKKDWAGAIAAYTRAMEFDRKHGAVDWALLSMRATTYYEAGDWPHARADARAALAYAPDEPSLLNFLGYSMTERHENLPEAEELLRKAHRLAPEEAAITDSLGWVRVEQGDVEGGLVLLEKAAEQIPEDPEVNYHLGEAYWRLGRRTEAVDQWNMALGLHPNPSDEKLIRAALERADMAPQTGVDEKRVTRALKKEKKHSDDRRCTRRGDLCGSSSRQDQSASACNGPPGGWVSLSGQSGGVCRCGRCAALRTGRCAVDVKAGRALWRGTG